MLVLHMHGCKHRCIFKRHTSLKWFIQTLCIQTIHINSPWKPGRGKWESGAIICGTADKACLSIPHKGLQGLQEYMIGVHLTSSLVLILAGDPKENNFSASFFCIFLSSLWPRLRSNFVFHCLFFKFYFVCFLMDWSKAESNAVWEKMEVI